MTKICTLLRPMSLLNVSLPGFRYPALVTGCIVLVLMSVISCLARTQAAPLYLPENINNRLMEDEVIYFVLPDRFYNGNPDNDIGGYENTEYEKAFNPKDKGFYHGGDIQGLIKKLDYIVELGATAIWLTPVLKNLPIQTGKDGIPSAAYHGYWTVDFTEIDPHFGTSEDLKVLISAAHAKGLKIFFDVITNHTADLIKFRECHDLQGNLKDGELTCPYRSLADVQDNPYTPFIPEKFKGLKVPGWLNNPDYYHNQGDTTFAGEDALNGDFEGMDDLKTEDPRVIEGMVDIFKSWIDIGVDGFRIDTVRNVNLEFWSAWAPQIKDYAAKVGKPNFFMFGEVYDYSVESRSEYTTLGDLPSVFDFSFQGVARAVFSNGRSNEAMNYLFNEDDYYKDNNSAPNQLVNFLGNHDMGRFAYFLKKDLSDADEDEYLKRVKLAHAFMFFARGIPVIYYGDEQGFVGDGGDRDAREDMLASQVDVYNDNDLLGTNATHQDENFNMDHPLFRAFRRYASVFKSHEALRRGEQIERFYDEAKEKADVYAFSRIIPEHNIDYLVVFNTANKADQVMIPAYSDRYSAVTGEGKVNFTQRRGVISLQMPPLSFIVLKGNSPVPLTDLPQIEMVWTGLEKGDVVSQRSLFEVELNTKIKLPLAAGYVEFSVKHPGSEKYQLISRDWTPPFRTLWHPGEIADKTPVEIKATFVARRSDSAHRVPVASAVIPLVVDRRVPDQLSIVYENGNQREGVFAISDQGRFYGPYSVRENKVDFSLRNSDSKLFLVFESEGKTTSDTGKSESRFDRPLLLSRADIVRGMTSENGKLVSRLYISNQHKVSTEPEFGTGGSPEVLSQSGASFTSAVYARGSFNGWAAVDELVGEKDGVYNVSRLIKAGDIEYKFADFDWRSVNLGGPYHNYGLTEGSNPANLEHRFERDETFRIEFFSLTDSAGHAFRFHKFTPLPGPLGLPLYVDGPAEYVDFDHGRRMAYVGNNRYLLPVRILNKGSLKMDLHVKDNSGDASLNGRAAPATYLVQIDQSVTITDLPGKIEAYFPEPGNYMLRLDIGADESQSLLIYEDLKGHQNSGPYGKDLFVRGSMNNWLPVSPLKYEGGKRYQTVLYLEEGSHQLKIADEMWSSGSNLGSNSGAVLKPGDTNSLHNASDSGNLSLVIPESGVFRFVLTVSNLSAPHLTVEEVSQVIVHYYLPGEDRWDTEFVDIDAGESGFETWFIESLGEYFESQALALKALDSSAQ